jgi:hypothetical protein
VLWDVASCCLLDTDVSVGCFTFIFRMVSYPEGRSLCVLKLLVPV